MERVSDTLDVMVGGKPIKLFMSFSLLNRVVKIFGDVSDATALVLSPDLQEDAVLEIMKAHTETKREIYTLDDFPMDRSTGAAIVAWATEHVLDFFIQGLQTAEALGKKMEPLVTAKLQTSSPSGSEPSPS